MLKMTKSINWKCYISLLCCCLAACATNKEQENLKGEISRLLIERDSLFKMSKQVNRLQTIKPGCSYIDSPGGGLQEHLLEMRFPLKHPPWIEER